MSNTLKNAVEMVKASKKHTMILMTGDTMAYSPFV